jgi:hypothetical protein
MTRSFRKNISVLLPDIMRKRRDDEPADRHLPVGKLIVA